jgi:hypothetical protein
LVSQFATHLNGMLERAAIPDNVRNEVKANVTKMAALKPPADADPTSQSAINSAVTQSFLYSFKLMMWICAALALVSAAVAWSILPSGPLIAAAEKKSPSFAAAT